MTEHVKVYVDGVLAATADADNQKDLDGDGQGDVCASEIDGDG